MYHQITFITVIHDRIIETIEQIAEVTRRRVCIFRRIQLGVIWINAARIRGHRLIMMLLDEDTGRSFWKNMGPTASV